MDKEEIDGAIYYGTHAYSRKEAEFIHAELDEKVQVGHVAVSPLELLIALQNQWLLPVVVTPHVGRIPRLISVFI